MLSTFSFTYKRARKRKTKPKINRRNEIMKIRVEISEIETKINPEKINETNRWYFEKN